MRKKDGEVNSEGEKKNENEATINYAKIIIEKLADIEKQLTNLPDTPLTLNETAEYLKLSQKHLYRLTYQKKIPFYKPCGKVIYFFKRELEMWIKRNCEFKAMPTGRRVMNFEWEEENNERRNDSKNKREIIIELPMKRKKKKSDFSFQK